MGPELAASFGITLERLQDIDKAQPYGVILPPDTKTKRREEPLSPDTKTKRREDEHAREPKVIKSFWEWYGYGLIRRLARSFYLSSF